MDKARELLIRALAEVGRTDDISGWDDAKVLGSLAYLGRKGKKISDALVDEIQAELTRLKSI